MRLVATRPIGLVIGFSPARRIYRVPSPVVLPLFCSTSQFIQYCRCGAIDFSCDSTQRITKLVKNLDTAARFKI